MTRSYNTYPNHVDRDCIEKKKRNMKEKEARVALRGPRALGSVIFAYEGQQTRTE